MVIIMAAGRGSRMGLEEGRSKCSIDLNGSYLCSVSNTINQFVRLGIDKNFVVVTGYSNIHLVSTINFSKDKTANVTYIYNNFWENRGSCYSLVTAWSTIQENEPLYIVEGDSVFSDDNLNLISSCEESSCLVRSGGYLSSRSVAVVTNFDKVSVFMYDSTHSTDFSKFNEINLKTYDSMQLWKISSSDTKLFKRILKEVSQNYIDYGSSGFKDQTNLVPLNRIISLGVTMNFVETEDPDGWVNLNTKEDIQKAKDLISSYN